MQASANSAVSPRFPGIVALLAVAAILYGAAAEFYGIASGTGVWIGQMSPRWALAFAVFIIFCCVCLWLGFAALTHSRRLVAILGALARLRIRIGPVRFVLAGLFAILPIWFLQYSPWGVVFSQAGTRLLTWVLVALVIAFLLESAADTGISRGSFILGVLVSGSLFAIAAGLSGVTSYPFSLSWSEGNRLWDYSLLFGSHLYQLPPNSQAAAYLDLGRQLAGGLPFLLPHVSIIGERLWLASLSILPYMILGWAMFWPVGGGIRNLWILLGLFAFLFLSQGPIHTPLLIVAVLVALAWRLPRWPAALLMGLAAYAAETSRFTWIFAPSIWIVMLELGGAELQAGKIPRRAWERAITLGVAGLLGGAAAILGSLAPGATSVAATAAASTKQPLLWYRLFPNATYGYGILLGLFIASAPLTAMLLVLSIAYWRRSLLQRLVIVLALLAFLVVGLVVSTKIGGGGDLHNLDMFLIGILFVAASQWKAGGERWLRGAYNSSGWISLLLAAVIAIPAYQPLMELRPLSFSQDTSWLTVLTGAQRPRDLGSLPGTTAVEASLQSIARYVAQAQSQGPVLFMDQRQLLTFGYLTGVQLIPDYEKKRMMDEALSSNAAYFQPFYQDLADHRFSLIISSPLRTPVRDSDYGFGEENNAWVKWVAKPVLCYYDELDTLTDVRVELLVPKPVPQDCSSVLP